MARKSRNTGRRPHDAVHHTRRAPEKPETWWDRLAPRTQHLACLGALLLLSLLFFAPVHFSGLSIIGSDTVNWRSMAQGILEATKRTGERPLWLPNAFGGMPVYTISYLSSVPQIDSLLTLLRSFLWPTSHFFVLLAGTYALVYHLTREKLSAVFSAAAFGLTTYMMLILVTGHNTKFIALCYAPWLLLAFAHALRRPNLLSGLLFAAALALNLRANHIQITYYIGWIIGIWWIVALVFAARAGELKTIGLATLWLLLGAVLGVAMVAQPYLVMAEYKAFTQRGAAAGAVAGGGGLDWSYAMAWSQGFGELLTLLVANIFGGEGALYWGPKPFTAGPHYVGGIVIALAIVGVWRGRKPAGLALGIAAVVMMLFSLGEYFPLLNRPFFDYFPLFSSFRVPETWLSAVALVLAVLAGIGLARVARRDESAEADRRDMNAGLIALGVVAVPVLILLLFGSSLLSFERPNEFEQTKAAVAQQLQIAPDSPQAVQTTRQYLSAQVAGPRVEAFRQDTIRTLVFLLFAAAVLFFFRRGALPHWAVQVALALLVIVDLWGVDRRYFNKDMLAPAPDVAAQIPNYDFDQFLTEQQRTDGGLGHFRVLSFESNNPITNARPSYYYESVGGYSAAKLRLYQDFAENVLFDPRTGMPNESALDLLNTRYIIAPGVLPGTEPVFQGSQGMLVLKNTDAAPRAFFVGRTEVIASAEETWARLRSPAFDPREVAILPEPLDLQTTAIDAGSTASVTLQSYEPDAIEWQVATDAPRLFVASEIYYPAGWNAYLDGQPVPIHRVDYLLRGVAVPEGSHRLEMRFEPATERSAFWLTLISTILVYGGIVVLLGLAYNRRRQGSAQEGGE